MLTCLSLRSKYDTVSHFNEYKELLDPQIEKLTNYISSMLKSDLQTQTPSAQQRIRENLTTLQKMEEEFQTISKCVSSEMNSRQDISSKLYDLQQEVNKKQKLLKEMEVNTDIAKERQDVVTNPYDSTTRWEGWFPLHRPLKQSSIPVLIGLSIFLLTMSVFLFLQVSYGELNITNIFKQTRNSNSFLPTTSLFS